VVVAQRDEVDVGVLICDDVEAIRALFSGIVGSHAGLTVVGEASDGVEAVSKAADLQPGIVLLDVSMPNLSGLDALVEIRHVAPAAGVIVVSGLSSPMIAEEAITKGAARFVEKGEPRAILAVIDAVVAERSVSRPDPS
jgi:DNA-binding NarL/FixJ family response regulator